MPEQPTPDLGQRLPAPLRLRSAGVGVAAGGPALAALSLLAPFGPAAGVLVVVAVLGAVVYRQDLIVVQLFLGVGAVGVIGLLEAATNVGLGLEALELAVLATILGLVDICFGTIIYRFYPGSDE